MDYCNECDGRGEIEEVNEVFHPEIGMVIDSIITRRCYCCEGTGLDLRLARLEEGDYFLPKGLDD